MTGSRLSLFLGVFLLGFAAPHRLLAAPSEAASLLRVVVVSNASLGGVATSSGALDAACVSALQKLGTRVVDLPIASTGQRMAFSDAIQAGKLPTELSEAVADALLTADLKCASEGQPVLGTDLRALQCSLHARIVRVSSGEVLFSRATTLTGHGLTMESALSSLTTRFGPLLAEGAASLVSALTAVQRWNLDVWVTDLPGHTSLVLSSF